MFVNAHMLLYLISEQSLQTFKTKINVLMRIYIIININFPVSGTGALLGRDGKNKLVTWIWQ